LVLVARPVAKLILDRFPGHDENFTSLMMVMVVEDVIAVFLLFLTPELAGIAKFRR